MKRTFVSLSLLFAFSALSVACSHETVTVVSSETEDGNTGNASDEDLTEVGNADEGDDKPLTHYNYSEKMSLGYHNPLSDFMFWADPTAVEYNGRLYVYGTNDTQQWEESAKGAQNTYEKIHSFQVMSTEDMVNWTYHGTIDVKAIQPQGRGVSWAPSIVSRVEADGLTHFYLYYSSSGAGVGLITATHPLGPWTAPLEGDFIDYQSPLIGDCPNPFDPGVVMDDSGTAWLAFGGGVAQDGTDMYPGVSRICRLTSDMLGVDGEVKTIPAPYFFEASELNYMGGQWVYIFNTSWKARTEWNLSGLDAPSTCSMCYMTSTTPLDPTSWTYKGVVLRNPGEEGMEYGNNHTHLHKFKGNYYMMYHTQHYEKSLSISGGYRSLCIDPIEVNEETATIRRGSMTHTGCNQLQTVKGLQEQSAAQAAATYGVTYEQGEGQGEMWMHATAPGQAFRVEGVEALGAKKLYVKVKGKGSIYLRKGSAEGDFMARAAFDTADWKWVKVSLKNPFTTLQNLCFVSGEGDFYFASWKME